MEDISGAVVFHCVFPVSEGCEADRVYSRIAEFGGDASFCWVIPFAEDVQPEDSFRLSWKVGESADELLRYWHDSGIMAFCELDVHASCFNVNVDPLG